MKFLRSRGGAALITAVVVLCSAVFGMGRSLNAVRGDSLEVFEQGQFGDGRSVKADLEARQAVAANLYTVALRYLPENDPQMMALAGARNMLLDDHGDTAYPNARLVETANDLIQALEAVDLSEKDAQYVSGFRAELQSRTLSIARDPYTAEAIRFNTETLAAFPASLARSLDLVEPLPVYT